MKVLIEKVTTEDGKPNGELYIESDTSGYQVVHYSDTNAKVKGVETDKKVVISQVSYMTVAGCAKYILNRKIKESTATDLKGLRADFLRFEAWIHEVIEF
jgi:hypothetical protein